MDFIERYKDTDVKTLIEMIDSTGSYTEDCMRALKTIYYDRKVEKKVESELAKKWNRQRARMQFERLDPLNDEIKILESDFLDHNELKKIYKDELNAFIQDQDAFRFDVWHYTIGAI